MSPNPSAPFDLLDPGDPGAHRKAALAERRIPAALGRHAEAAQHYRPAPDLVDAVNVSLAVGAPLLLTGEPGTGKTQVAHYLAWYFGIDLHPLYVRSDANAEDLLYRFDAVAYLHAAQDPKRQSGKLDRAEFIDRGPLWRAYEAADPCVVLIDEIDKAPRDFPNDLLNVLDQHEFTVAETGRLVSREERPPPVVVITSNSERRLPEPFLRRCIFHHIVFDERLVQEAVTARQGDFPELDAPAREAAIRRFMELRALEIRKKPATAELLVWLTVLAAQGGVTADRLSRVELMELPALACLIKDRGDFEAL